MPGSSHYQLLQVAPTASREELRQAFRQLSKRFHPDTTELPVAEAERAFQQLQQLAGRIGRRAERGVMMIQTYQPEHEVLKALKTGDYNGLMETEMEQREVFGYPPFTKLLKIDVKHLDAQVATEASRWLADQLRKQLGNLVLGPQVPSVARVKNRFIQQIVVKIPRESAKLNAAKHLVQQAREAALAHLLWRAVRIDVVVDPN